MAQFEATLNGVVNANNNTAAVTFEYGLTTAYGTLVTADQSPVTGNIDTPVSKSISGLSAGTTYHYRVVGQNTDGTSYGLNKTFTTISADPNAPTAVTGDPSGMSATGATLSGTVDTKNQSTEVLFEYGLTAAYGDTAPANQSPVISEFPVMLNATLTGLISDTTYHYRVVAQNEFGIAYGLDRTLFTAAPQTPTAVTDSASSVATESAVLNGTVNANNSYIFSINFEYGTSESYGRTLQADPYTASGVSNTAVAIKITGLTNNTIYHYRVAVQGQTGLIYGSDMTFTTGQSAPIATTGLASEVGITSAVVNGMVNANNTTVTVIFEYGPDTIYGRTGTANQNPVTGNTDVAVSDSLVDLQPNALYHYRVVAQNVDNTVYGEDRTFTTLGTAPEVTTNTATGISNASAILNGTAKANNDSTTVTFEYGLTEAYGITVPADQNPLTGNAVTAFSANITNLTADTTYHYRVIAKNSFGVAYGADKTFFTGAAIPSATTSAATDIGLTTATLHGVVIANNAPTAVSFEYGRDTGYGRTVDGEPNEVSGSENSEVHSVLSGLLPGTTYHYRIVATNMAGTTNGTDETFTTSTIADTDREPGKPSVPTEYTLSQNYPNPFNPTTVIGFALPNAEFVDLRVYDILGNEIVTLVSDRLNQGYHTRTFDGKNLAAGVYYYRLVAGDFSAAKKLILIK